MSAAEHTERATPDSVRELAENMRELRIRSGLTLAALAARTGVSKSSWERYLNGKKFPPRTAVVAFARAVGVKADRLLLLWDLAAQSRHRAAERGPADGERGPADGTPGAEPASDGATRGAAGGAGEARPGAAEGSVGSAGGPAVRRARAVAVVRSRWTVLVAVVLAGLVLGAGVLLRGGGDADAGPADLQGARSGECVGFECRGKHPQREQCHHGAWTAALIDMSGSWVELRYSPSCRAAWARITQAEVGDAARVVGVKGGHHEEQAISFDRDTFSPMLEAAYPGAVRACGVKPVEGGGEPEVVCTEPGGSTPIPQPPPGPAAPAPESGPSDPADDPADDPVEPDTPDGHPGPPPARTPFPGPSAD